MLEAVPLDQEAAFAFVGEVHRHHQAPQGWKFGIGAMKDGELVGVVIVGRPVSRHQDDGAKPWTKEVPTMPEVSDDMLRHLLGCKDALSEIVVVATDVDDTSEPEALLDLVVRIARRTLDNRKGN